MAAAKKKATTKKAAKTVAAKKPKAKASPRKSPFGKVELDHFRDLLLDRRARILKNVNSMEAEALKAADQDFSVDHMADHGSDNFEQDFTLSLVESERRELFEIDQALGRLREGTYGICEGTGESIGRPRLEAIPYTRYSIEYQRRLEAGEVEEGEVDQEAEGAEGEGAEAEAEESGEEE
jgi:RNA polymerase-binding protein DksA